MELITTEDQYILAELETMLIAKLRPTFLVISYADENSIDVIISTVAFANMGIQERVNSVFSLISKLTPDIIKEKLIVVQTFSSNEIQELLEDMFK
jgi:hypothetical protein